MDYTTRDLNNLDECQEYCAKLLREYQAWLSYSEKIDMEMMIRHGLVKLNKDYVKYINGECGLIINDDLEYLQSWIMLFINSSYDLKVQNEINFF